MSDKTISEPRTSEKIYVFKVFERLWHWGQAGLIILLMATGFEVHGLYRWLGFERAVNLHTQGAWALIGLWLFAIFWHLTTGEWKQYIPTARNIRAVANYYLIGIFRNEPHPHRMTAQNKLNPMQKLTYFGVLVFIGPLLWATGWLYLFYDQWTAWGLAGTLSLDVVALGHLIGAYLMLLFLISHLYLITTGATPLSQLKAMITGWEQPH